jgi:hypothetical protein
MIPTYLEGFVKNYQEKDFSQMTICSKQGNDVFEVWYYGELFKVKGEEQLYIVETEFAPSKIIAKDPQTGEEILIFDGTIHGYNAMFCDFYSDTQKTDRLLKKLDIPVSKIVVELGYSIDYDDEKDDYDFDENDNVCLVNAEPISWEEVKRNGFDYIAISYINADGKMIQFVDEELA